jgi:hypothetical protein
VLFQPEIDVSSWMISALRRGFTLVGNSIHRELLR